VLLFFIPWDAPIPRCQKSWHSFHLFLRLKCHLLLVDHQHFTISLSQFRQLGCNTLPTSGTWENSGKIGLFLIFLSQLAFMCCCGHYQSMPPFSVNSLMNCICQMSSNQFKNVTCPWCQWFSSSSLNITLSLDGVPFLNSLPNNVTKETYLPQDRVFLWYKISPSFYQAPIGLSFDMSMMLLITFYNITSRRS